MKTLMLLFTFIAFSSAQQLVNSINVTRDTSQVSLTPQVWSANSAYYFAVPNDGMFDIYDYLLGKVASISINKQAKYWSLQPIIFNANNGWLLLYNINDSTGFGTTYKYKSIFKVFNGTTMILTDSSNVYPLYLGGYSYVYTSNIFSNVSNFQFSIWKLGTAPASASSLSKRTSLTAQPESFMTAGGLKIITNSNSNGFTAVELFDLAGRLAFSGEIPNGKPFVIPSNILPNSPFVTLIGGASANLHIKTR
jgi:hypothetical protein